MTSHDILDHARAVAGSTSIRQRLDELGNPLPQPTTDKVIPVAALRARLRMRLQDHVN